MSNENKEKKVPLNEGAIYLVEREVGRGLFPVSRGPFSKYLRFIYTLDCMWLHRIGQKAN